MTEKEKRDYAKTSKRITQAFHPPDFEQSIDHVISSPTDGTVGCLTWKTNKNYCDYLTIAKTEKLRGDKLRSEEIHSLDKHYSAGADKQQTMVRRGNAGGTARPTFDTNLDYISMTDCTKDSRVITKNPGSDSGVMNMLYTNEDTGEHKKYSVSADVWMDKLDGSQKMKEMNDEHLSCGKALRNKAIVQMKSRLHTYAIIEKLGLTCEDREHTKNPRRMWHDFVDAIHVAKQTVELWKGVDASLTLCLTLFCWSGVACMKRTGITSNWLHTQMGVPITCLKQCRIGER